MSKIIQFMHPGCQRNLEKWNETTGKGCGGCNGHSAKFMISRGKYLDGTTAAHPEENDLYFWGEYEPQSNKECSYQKTTNGMPLSLHRPCYPQFSSSIVGNLHTTDPFVLGGCFKYMCCMQEHFKCLRSLNSGDMILFGSRRGNGKQENEFTFGLDTVFVVESRQPFDSLSDLRLEIDDCHEKAMRELSQATELKLAFYRGATWEKQIDGMFSFVPASKEDKPFAKFPIRGKDAEELNRLIAPSKEKRNDTGIRLNTRKPVGISCIYTTQDSVKKVWCAIRDKVLNDEYVLGVQFDTPAPRR